MIIDATNLIMGRLGAFVAKTALNGEEVIILNADKAVIVGRKDFLVNFYKEKLKVGTPNYGPFYMRKPDRFLRRTFRGMLPWKNSRGKEAYKRIKCFIGVPNEYINKKAETIKEINVF